MRHERCLLVASTQWWCWLFSMDGEEGFVRLKEVSSENDEG